MRKLLNTIYVTKEDAYLSLDGETLLCKAEGQKLLRVPFDNIENIVCFNYMGCSPALMGKCVEQKIPINFVSPQGRFLAKVCGETKGNVFLRVAQIDCFRERFLPLAQNTMAAKFFNTRQVLRRSIHDKPELREDAEIQKAVSVLEKGAAAVLDAESVEEVIGIEGNCAREYFSVFPKLFRADSIGASFRGRTKHPPLDPVNAVLSFVYTLWTAEYASALETVGLDSYIGYCHALRSGRSSLACDLVEETRCFAERFVISMLNLKMLDHGDFTEQASGAVFLNDKGRKKVLTRYQEKKREKMTHPYLKEKVCFGLFPYVQSSLLAKYIRGDTDEYPPFLLKG